MANSNEILRTAQLRMQANAQDHTEQIGRWFAKNDTRLRPWVDVVVGTVQRRPITLADDGPSRIVEQLLSRLEAANPSEGRWGRQYQGLLELFVRVAIEILDAPKAPFDAQAVLLPTQAAERRRVNILAAQIAASDAVPSRTDLEVLKRYTGFGGLSLEQIRGQLPETLVPDTKALIDEYYTPPEVCRATADLVSKLVNGELAGPALEPAAGIGRFIGAFAARPDMTGLEWQAVEYSALSARILSKLYPALRVFHGPFESWLVENFNNVAGTLALVVTNPPYGKRGKNKLADPDKFYREDVAYVYFMRRAFDLLRPDGIGVALVPSGLLSGTGQASVKWRRQLLTRHHLICAYRLPSSIYPGANIVTDLSFWQARGGELSDVVDDDQFILEGRYFESAPGHILGEEKVSTRFRYQVVGTFNGLPQPDPRPMCRSCSAPKPFFQQLAPKVSAVDSLPERLKESVSLANRVSAYLDLAVSAREQDLEKASSLHPELIAAVVSWVQYQDSRLGSYDPHKDRELRAAANQMPSFAALLSIFRPEDAQLVAAFNTPPRFETSYRGAATLVAHAEWLYAKQRSLTIGNLKRFRLSQGFNEPSADSDLEVELAANGWCEDWPDEGATWLPGTDYFSGDLWPKLNRARAMAGERAKRQEAELLRLIGVATIGDAAPSLRDPWLPVQVVRAFLESTLQISISPLHWFRGLLKPREVSYADLGKVPEPLQVALGYINHDLGYFKIKAAPDTNPETGDEETAQQALDRVRLAYGEAMTTKIRDWLSQNPDSQREVVEAYARTFRGYVVKSYRPAPLNIARWGRRVSLRPHQLAAAWRLISNNGGLLAFDVGVGKTLTGIATLAYLRQIGRARRPIIIVPNSIVWKWFWELTRALPDYRVVVVGSTRYLGRGNIPRSRLDERSERAQKWSEFKLGLYDVALVTYSVFTRLAFSEEVLRQFIEETPPALRDVGFKAADLEEELEKVTKTIQDRNKLASDLVNLKRELAIASDGERPKIEKQIDARTKKVERMDKRVARLETIAGRLLAAKNASERNRAILQESINEWIAEFSEERESDGIDFESLRCDFLMLDEAQNMKNLWAVGRREGGVPKYLGAISEGSDRALSFALQSFVTQRETGGSGVTLLSATPAKNSPLELFTLLGFVDHKAWTSRGTLDPDYFIDRYLRLELKSVLKPDGSIESRTAVVGFRQLNELRDIVFRYGDFKNAEDVGLVLPETKIITRFLAMSDVQRQKYGILRREFEEIVTSPQAQTQKYKALGILQRMGLCALHPELIVPPAEGWSWSTAGRRAVEPSPKMIEAVALVTAKPECGHIIFVDNVAIHRWLFDLLVASGVPQERIAILNAERAPTALQRQQIAEGFNGTPTIVDPESGRIEQEGQSPIYDVVIANAVAYEGIDLQIRTCRVYHLDLPYEPATLQQRNGRAVRQGNTQSVVEVIYLLADKSYDAVRLAMIRGKLRWMSDIFRSADRETNNPAAQMDLSIEDMLLMLADDPEEAKAAMEQVRLRNEQERNARAVAQAWARIADLIDIVPQIERGASDLEKEQARKQAEELIAYLRAVPAQLWPWLFLVDAISAGTPATRITLQQNGHLTSRVVWEGLALPVGGGRLAYFGKVASRAFSWRHEGSHEWTKADLRPEAWEMLADVPPDAYLQEPPDDSPRWRPGLIKAIDHDVRWSGLAALKLPAAPDYWADAIWQEFGPRIIEELSKEYRGIPAREGSGVVWDRSGSLKWSQCIPPTNAGFAEFMHRIGQGKHSFTKVAEQSQEWWGREFPRGIADDREIITFLDENGAVIGYRIERTYAQWLAVVQVSEDRWNLADTRSGRWIDLGLEGPFLNVDVAKLVARWLATFRSDEGIFLLDDRKRSVVRWIELQSDLPTLAMVQAEFESNPV